MHTGAMHHNGGPARLARRALGLECQKIRSAVIQIDRLAIEQGVDDLFRPTPFLAEIARRHGAAQRHPKGQDQKSHKTHSQSPISTKIAR